MNHKVFKKTDIKGRITVVLVHGAYHGSWCWEEKFISFFVEKNCTVISIDFHDENKHVKVIDYIEYLDNIISQIQGEIYLVSHSLGTAISERYISEFSPAVTGVVFMAPSPVVKRMRRAFVINLHNIVRKKAEFYFSNRLKSNTVQKYINKFKNESKEMEFLMVRKNIPQNYNWKYRTLVLGSQNDKCMPLSVIVEAGMFFCAKIIIYERICHDMMLDPDWKLVAKDIYNFIQSVHFFEQELVENNLEG